MIEPTSSTENQTERKQRWETFTQSMVKSSNLCGILGTERERRTPKTDRRDSRGGVEYQKFKELKE